MPNQTPPSWLNIIKSALAAALGVHSSKNHERDFSSGSPKRFVLAGIIGTLLFVLTMVVVVKLALAGARTR